MSCNAFLVKCVGYRVVAPAYVEIVRRVEKQWWTTRRRRLRVTPPLVAVLKQVPLYGSRCRLVLVSFVTSGTEYVASVGTRTVA